MRSQPPAQEEQTSANLLEHVHPPETPLRQ
jgi:hypothetical protein